jgi:hypothetical protein
MRTNDLSTWWYWELLKEERKWGKHAMQAEGIRFEIERRYRNWKTIGLAITATGGVIAAFFTVLSYFRH